MSSFPSSITFAGSVQNAQIGDHNTLNLVNVSTGLTALVLQRYEPIRTAINSWHLVEAERDLRSFLAEIALHCQEDGATEIALRDLHQRLLLALGGILQWRGHYIEALEQWQGAKSLGDFNTERRQQEMALLANLGETDCLANVVAQCRYFEQTCNDMKAVLAWMQGDAEKALTLLPRENPSLDMQMLRVRILLSRLDEAGVVELQTRIDEAWVEVKSFPVIMMEAAELTLHLLQRIIDSQWEIQGLNREALLITLRERVSQTVDAWEPLEHTYPEGHLRALTLAAQFHLYLNEREALAADAERIRQAPVMVREKALTAYALQEAWYDQSDVAAFAHERALSPTQETLLTAFLQAHSGTISHAQQTLSKALVCDLTQQERNFLVEALVQMLIKNNQIEAANQLLQQEKEQLPETTTLLLEGAILLPQSLSATVAHFQAALQRFPRCRVLLENIITLIYALLSQSATEEKAEDTVFLTTLCQEALSYAQRLTTILPSPESYFAQAYWSAKTGKKEEALSLLRRIGQQEYRTRALLGYLAYLLQEKGEAQEVAETLTGSLARYPNDYELAWQCGTAWALINDYVRAIAILNPLLEHPEAGVELYINLALAQQQAAASEPERANAAFDLLREAFRKFPLEPTLPARLLEAGYASHRMREVHQLLDAIDLSDNPHFRYLTDDEALTYITKIQEHTQMRWASYEAGILPFTFLSQHSPRPIWYSWWARLALFKQQADAGDLHGNPVLVDLLTLRPRQSGARKIRRRVLLDMTTILTLGSIGALPEVLVALTAGRWIVHLFPEAIPWMETETSRLRTAQWPLERQRYAQLEMLLRQSRQHVTLHSQTTPAAVAPTEERLRHLGARAFDVAEAEAAQGYYLDDHLDPASAAFLLPETRRTSRDLLMYLEERGIILTQEVQQLRETLPQAFLDDSPIAPIEAKRPIVISEIALLAWQESGLLAKWVEGGIGWPPLVVGPYAQAGLYRANTEARLHREALAHCEAANTEMKAASRSNVLRSCPSVPRLKLQIGNLSDLWKPALEVLAVASHHDLVVCADDLFLQLILDPRGLLGEEVALRVVENQVRRRFRKVDVINTAELIEQLASSQHLPAERADHFQWQLFQHGYRGQSLRGALRWLLDHVPLRSTELPVPYQALVDALTQSETWLAPHINGPRRHHYVRTAITILVQELLITLWSYSGQMPAPQKSVLADALLGCFEKVTQI